MLIHPTVHLNGTSRKALTEQFQDQMEAIDNAQQTLMKNGPNARDYYVQGAVAYIRATEQHARRLEALRNIKEELYELLMGVAK